MPKWSDFGSIWNTFKEIDVSAIRDEAEQAVTIGCVGHPAALDALQRLFFSGAQRYPAAGANPLRLIALPDAPAQATLLGSANLLIFALDSGTALTPVEQAAFSQLEQLRTPFLVAQIGASATPANLSRFVAAQLLVLPDPDALDAADRLAVAVLARLPENLHLPAARKLPGLRAAYARDLIGSTSFANGGYSLATGIPELVPILNVPFVAADMLVLTKNQALMVYRLALAHGAPPDFQERIREVLPVVGGAFIWRQIARGLIGLIPGWSVVPKVAIAYGATYATGTAAWRWFANGELVSTDQLKQITAEAMALGRARAAEIIERARSAQAEVGQRVGKIGLRERLRQLWPWGRKRQPPAINAPPEPDTKS